MTDITKLDLENSQPKFVSVGNNVFVSSSGKSEVCRKGQQGLFCRRHHGSSFSSQPEVRAMLDRHANRTVEKLSPFENGCIWLYSVLMRMPLEEARAHYIESTAMYSLLGARKPSDIEVKGLQKVLMGLIESSKIQDTRMDKLKTLVKNMAFGRGFTEAGFYTLKDMAKATLNKMKLGVAGIALGATLTLSGCAGINPINSFTNIGKSQVYTSGTPELTEIESVEDEFGSYKRTTIKDTSSVVLTTDGIQNKEEGAAAKDFVVKFIVEETLDSIALDNEAQWDSWKTNVAPKYIHPDYIDEILSSETVLSSEWGTFGGKGIVLTDAGNSMPNLKRDGGARSTDKLFKTFTVDQDRSSAEIMYVYTTGSSFYRVTDEDSKAFWRGFYGNNDFDSKGQLNDGIDQSLQVDFNLSYTLKKHDGQWKIAGFSNEFLVLTGGLKG